jgi:hypothetical protein
VGDSRIVVGRASLDAKPLSDAGFAGSAAAVGSGRGGRAQLSISAPPATAVPAMKPANTKVLRMASD